MKREHDTACRVAFVLGSSGVAGMAALGVVDRLARDGIRPAVLAGCGSGAFFAAAVASAMQRLKLRQAAALLWPADDARRPRGAWPFGDRQRIVENELRACFGEARLETLPIPLRVALADAASGQPVLLRRGRLSDVLGASLAPAERATGLLVEDRLLVSGVDADPLPLAAVDDADVVIALGLYATPPPPAAQARLQAACRGPRRLVHLELGFDAFAAGWSAHALTDLYEAGWHAAESRLLDVLALVEEAQLPAAA